MNHDTVQLLLEFYTLFCCIIFDSVDADEYVCKERIGRVFPQVEGYNIGEGVVLEVFNIYRMQEIVTTENIVDVFNVVSFQFSNPGDPIALFYWLGQLKVNILVEIGNQEISSYKNPTLLFSHYP